MNSIYSHDKILQSIQKNRKRYKAIALSTAITLELEDFMIERSISKQELAKAAGVSPSYLSQVLSGDKLINISMLAGISHEYKVRFKVEIHDTKSDGFLEQASRMNVKLGSRRPLTENDFSVFKKNQNGNWTKAMGG